MSAVQPCLEPKEMTTTNVDFLESFKTVDEEKDSDDESFHLPLYHLDGEDELTKNDDKIQLNEVEEDASKIAYCNDEEKEKVNEPDAVENADCILENISPSPEPENKQQSDDEKFSDDINIPQNGSNEEAECENISKNVESNLENAEETITGTEGDTEEILATKITEKTDECAEISSVTNINEQIEIDTEETDKESIATVEENSGIVEENSGENDLKMCTSDDDTVLMETEDDILNKHAEVNDFEDLDPTLEESLLNETDEVGEKQISDQVTSNIESSGIEVEAPVLEPEAPTLETETTLVESETTLLEPEAPVLEPEATQISQSEDTKIVNDKSVTNPETEDVTIEKISEKMDTQKGDDNSNGSTPSDTEDLLDISMIKDSAQDDADIAEDAFQLEQENEDSDDTARSHTKTVERLESVDDSSNLENSDEDGKEGYCSESQETSENPQTDLSDSEKDKNVPESEGDKEENLDKELEDLQCEDQEHQDESLHLDSTLTSEEVPVPNTDKAPMKRALSDDIPDIPESEPKKIKLVEETPIEDDPDAWDITDVQSLISFSQFMTKSQLKKLTRSDLEEFCIQKLCEAILHKSELGETNHKLKKQEQTIEALRKEQLVLTKQIKDLEIVKKKLMHEVKNHLGNKPIVPVKITRSVGLQVRMTPTNDPNSLKRRSAHGTPQKVQTPIQNQVMNSRSPRAPQNQTVNRQVLQKSPQKQQTTPILSQVLQTRTPPVANKPTQNQKTTPVRASPKPKPEKRQRTTGSFIDLTDEDDKRTNTKTPNKTAVPQGVRINTVPKTTGSSVLPSVVTSSAPQVMYVVQSNSQIKQGLLTTPAGQQKAVLVNFQPTNGVINSLNSSSVSVIPKVTPNVQLKTTSSLVKVNKHPAPFPNPPVVQLPNDKSLKGIPPKPVLSIRKTNTGIILQWRMPYDLGLYEGIASYQLYAYQVSAAAPSTDMWRKVGDVKAMALPMACTLTQFADKNKYYFAVRPVDIHKRIGRFSNPEEISL